MWARREQRADEESARPGVVLLERLVVLARKGRAPAAADWDPVAQVLQVARGSLG